MPKTSSTQKDVNSNIPIKSSQELIDEIVTKNQQDSEALDHYFKQNMKRVKGSGLDIYHKFNKKDFYEFASVMKPIVLKVLNDKGFPTNAANDIVRQAALESSYGTKPTGTYNLGGIKYFDTTGPNRTYTVSKEDNVRYTNFDNLYDYVDYKVQLLNDRYNALESTSTDDFINRLHDGKYKYSDDKEKYQELKYMKSLDRHLDYPYRFQVGGQFVAKRDGTRVVPIEVHEKVKMTPEQILRSKGLVPRQQTIREDKRTESQRKEDDRQGRMKYNDQKRKEEEAKINRGIWTGIGLGGLALAQATPAAPYIDGLMAAHGAYGLGKQADEGTLGLNIETAGHVLETIPVGVKLVPKAVKTVDNIARNHYAPYDLYRTVQETKLPTQPYLNIGWGPKVKTTGTWAHTKPNEKLSTVISDGTIRWDAKRGMPTTGGWVTEGQPAGMMAERPYIDTYEVTLNKPIIQVGEIPTTTKNATRSQLVRQAESMGADGVQFKGIADNKAKNQNVTYIFDPDASVKFTRRSVENGRFVTRPSSLTEAEKLGIPKVDRNQYFKNGVNVAYRSRGASSTNYPVDYFSATKTNVFGKQNMYAYPKQGQIIVDAKGAPYANLGETNAKVVDKVGDIEIMSGDFNPVSFKELPGGRFNTIDEIGSYIEQNPGLASSIRVNNVMDQELMDQILLHKSTPRILIKRRGGIISNKQFDHFVSTLPDNLKPGSDYDMYSYWEINGKPKDFNKAVEDKLFVFNDQDSLWHAYTLAWDARGNGRFMKSKNHPTLYMETDRFRHGIITDGNGTQRRETPEEKADFDQFRNNYKIIDDPDRPGYYMYIRK